MKVSILGADGNILCQVNALRNAFAELGHEHTYNPLDNDVAFVFIGNPPYEKYLDIARLKEKKIIFNVLDIPWHVPEVDEILERLKNQLPLASRVTTISKAVQSDLRNHCNIDSDVIYYPMKPVFKTKETKPSKFKVAMVGRLLDKNKYANIAISSIINAGFLENEVIIVGPEYIGWGVNAGVVNDEQLNNIYNSVDYVIMLDKVAGIGLPAIEAACCGAIPIILPHLSTFDEFWTQSPLSLNYQSLTSVNKIGNLIRSIESNPVWKNDIKQELVAYSELFFRPKFDAKNVAKRIIEVYQTI